MENNKNSVLDKLSQIKNDIEKVDKNQSGYNFKYENPEEIVKVVIKQLQDKKIDHHMSMHVPTQFEKDSAELIQMTETNKSGKEKIQWISRFKIDHTYVDLETGETVTFVGIGSGKADQPGQADGAAWSYARRQEYEKRFAITIDKPEKTLNTDLKYTVDSDGVATEVMKESEYRQITTHIARAFGLSTVDEIRDVVNKVMERLNKDLGTEYSKLSVVPQIYVEDVLKTISIIKNLEDKG